MKAAAPNPNQVELPFVTPSFHYPVVKIPQADGSILVKAGKPVQLGDEIGTLEASELLGIDQRQVARYCETGRIRSAFKPGGTDRSSWRMSRAEVLARRNHQGDQE